MASYERDSRLPKVCRTPPPEAKPQALFRRDGKPEAFRNGGTAAGGQPIYSAYGVEMRKKDLQTHSFRNATNGSTFFVVRQAAGESFQDFFNRTSRASLSFLNEGR